MNLQIDSRLDLAVAPPEAAKAIREAVAGFIVSNFLFGDMDKKPGDEESLIGTATVDSTGILELIEFIEDRFHIEVLEEETVPRNLDSIANLTRFIHEKRDGPREKEVSP